MAQTYVSYDFGLKPVQFQILPVGDVVVMCGFVPL